MLPLLMKNTEMHISCMYDICETVEKNSPQNIAHKSQDWTTRTPLKSPDEIMCAGSISCARCVTVKGNMIW